MPAFMDFKIEKVERHDDSRGELIILLQKKDLPKKNQTFGEIFYITFAKKGTVRANHYHKNWREWFVVVSGRIKVELEDIKTKKRLTKIIDTNSNLIERLEIGPNVAHAFKAETSNACLLNYSNLPWKKKDVIPYILIPQGNPSSLKYDKRTKK